MFDITRIQEELHRAGYVSIADNNPAIFKVLSPHTGRPILIPLGIKDSLSEVEVRSVLGGEPNLDNLIALMQ